MHTGCLTLFGGLSRSTIRAAARTETVVSSSSLEAHGLYQFIFRVWPKQICPNFPWGITPSHIRLQVQGSGDWPRPVQLLRPEVWAVARRAHHQPQGRAVPASQGGAAGSNTEIDTHQVAVFACVLNHKSHHSLSCMQHILMRDTLGLKHSLFLVSGSGSRNLKDYI